MNVKPGDLAIVVRGCCAGRIVEVIRPCVKGELFISTTGHMTRVLFEGEIAWVCKSSSPLKWINNFNEAHFYDRRSFYDSNLRPVSGLPDEQTTDEELKQPA